MRRVEVTVRTDETDECWTIEGVSEIDISLARDIDSGDPVRVDASFGLAAGSVVTHKIVCRSPVTARITNPAGETVRVVTEDQLGPPAA